MRLLSSHAHKMNVITNNNYMLQNQAHVYDKLVNKTVNQIINGGGKVGSRNDS